MSLNTVAKPDIDHSIVMENTKTTKETDRIERGLASIYRKIGKLIIADKDFPNLGTLREYYTKAFVKPVTMRAVHDIYLLGVDYVNLFFKTQGFLSPSKDDPRIEDIANEMVDTFWRKIRIYALRYSEIKNGIDMGIDPKQLPKLFDLDSMLNQTATTLATWTLKTATVFKLQDMADQIKQLDYRTIKNEVKGSVALKGMGRAILEDVNAVNREDIKEGKTRPLTTKDIFYVWEARLDERTCEKLPDGSKGCRYLHGERWSFDRAGEVPTPSGTGRNPTHYNCRCRIVIYIGNDGFYA